MSTPAGAAVLVVLAAAFSAAAGPQQPRDLQRPRAAGTGTIRGLVVSEEASPQPLRRARIVLSSADADHTQTVISAEDGRFAFSGLRPGRYYLRASKEGYVQTSFGSTRPGRPGTSVEIRTGQQRDVTLALPRGAVITGRILEPDGSPASGIQVLALTARYVASAGARLLNRSPHTALTDDRGVYRIHGLSVGEYVIASRPAGRPEATNGVHVLTDAEIRDALADLPRQVWRSRPGQTVTPPLRTRAAESDRTSIGLAQMFYPGSPFAERAAVIRLAPGEIRAGIDLDLQYVPLASVEGHITSPYGVDRVQVTLSPVPSSTGISEAPRAVSLASGGQFRFSRVPPGTYRVLAFAQAQQPGQPTPRQALMGTTEVAVTGDDVAGLSVVLQPGLSISGTVRFDPPEAAPAALPKLATPALVSMDIPPATPSLTVEGNAFRMSGVAPGPHRYGGPQAGVHRPIGQWWLRSILVEGREFLDDAPALTSNTDDVVVTFSTRASELTGLVRDSAGRPARDPHVIVFARDERAWFPHSRRIAVTRPDANGDYSIRNLPPGDYWVAVTADVMPEEWFDPEVLRELGRGATAVRISGEGRHELNLIAPSR